jgi:hypothetical protein
MQPKLKNGRTAYYFTLSIHHRINERQHRNRLNINLPFAATFFKIVYLDGNDFSKNCSVPVINNGIYHHQGKNHCRYPVTFYPYN